MARIVEKQENLMKNELKVVARRQRVYGQTYSNQLHFSLKIETQKLNKINQLETTKKNYVKTRTTQKHRKKKGHKTQVVTTRITLKMAHDDQKIFPTHTKLINQNTNPGSHTGLLSWKKRSRKHNLLFVSLLALVTNRTE